MSWLWKAAISFVCVVLPCCSPALWCFDQNTADQKKLAQDAKQARTRAEHGNAKAQDNLAMMYYYGKGVPKNYVEAVLWWRKAAEQGDAKGQYNLGGMYHEGKGVAHDDAEAAYWYRKAADQGAAIAEDALGTAYYDGDGVPQDFPEALLWYRKAADQGNADAQNNVGLMYYNGRGIPRDYKEAGAWFRKAADQGYAVAQYNLGWAYSKGQGVAHDNAEAVHWYRKAADQGAAIAEDALGTAYSDGDGVPQDFPEALLWYRKAADQGNADAQNNVGLMHYNGRGIPRDYKEAAAWFRKAADQGYADAQYNLGYAYSKGQGVLRDYGQAATWTRKAADQNYAKAQRELGYMYYYGKGVDEDYVQAADWYRKAAEQGYGAAQYDLGLMYLKGNGVRQDRAEADKWFRKAAAQGDASAKRELTGGPGRAHKVRNLLLLMVFLGAIWITTEFLLKRGWVDLYTLRRYVALVFGATTGIFVIADFRLILRLTRPRWTLEFLFLALLPRVALASAAAVFGTACWTSLRGKQSARAWGIVASLISVLVPIWPITSFPEPPWKGFGVILAAGVVGLVAFSHRLNQSDDPARVLEKTRNPGDGTSGLFNAITAFLVIAATLLAHSWWRSWTRTNGISVVRGGWSVTLMWVLIVVFILILHELGHTVAGLGLGMKLRGFVVGPFQWYLREGRWEFHFKLTSILGGQTVLVPTSVDFPRWHELTMVAAGALANVSTGLLALWAAIASKAHGWQYARGALGLFAAWSMVVGLANLLPFGTPDSYSDGAQIYQILSKGPWGDFRRAVRITASTLVTSLRPRDYDIQTILRAAQGITRGLPAMGLRLLAYSYFLDHDKFPEAREALKEAGSMYEQCAPRVPAELLTEFVFGSAYVLREAAATRQWWSLMQAKKPARFNSDYWKAASALHWIEGNLKEANVAWEKCNALARKLPSAGAYEFDRDCCSRLRRAIDEAMTNTGNRPIGLVAEKFDASAMCSLRRDDNS